MAAAGVLPLLMSDVTSRGSWDESPTRGTDPLVELTTPATRRGAALASATASGVADGLELDLEDATRLHTIVSEAADNVVAHAYPDQVGGSLTLRVGLEAEPSPLLRILVEDEGQGIALPPSAADPPGLGLSIITTLSDSVVVGSPATTGGTTLAASMLLDEEAGERPRGPAPQPTGAATELSLSDEAVASSVLPRVLMVHVGAQEGGLQRASEAILVGDAIAHTLEGDTGSDLIELRIAEAAGAPRVETRVGPLPEGAVAALVEEIENESWSRAGSPSVRVDAAGGDAYVVLELAKTG